ncbi:MAG TPA: CBS domain-containing protein [Herpetosiphonaceae bacterium]|nr:CBS domain-containing protein [Herpetosiphonaceae bacterium]
MKVRDIMTANVEAVGPETDLVTIARRMKDLNVGSLPVVENDQLVGIITDRDIVIRGVAEGLSLQEEQVRNYLTPHPMTVTPDADAREAAELMGREQIRRLPVVEGGRLVGMLAIGDVAVDVGKDRLVGDALQQISEPAQPREEGVR